MQPLFFSEKPPCENGQFVHRKHLDAPGFKRDQTARGLQRGTEIGRA